MSDSTSKTSVKSTSKIEHLFIGRLTSNSPPEEAKDSASKVANFFLEKASEEKTKLTPLKLMSLVYVAYCRCLIVLGKDILDNETVEAQTCLPIIPSLYNSYKHLVNHPINNYSNEIQFITHKGQSRSKTVEIKSTVPRFSAATSKDAEPMQILEMVWRQFKNVSTADIVSYNTATDSPWDISRKANDRFVTKESILKCHRKRDKKQGVSLSFKDLYSTRKHTTCT